jgi:beta-glucanase (GH16 family)
MALLVAVSGLLVALIASGSLASAPSTADSVPGTTSAHAGRALPHGDAQSSGLLGGSGTTIGSIIAGLPALGQTLRQAGGTPAVAPRATTTTNASTSATGTATDPVTAGTTVTTGAAPPVPTDPTPTPAFDSSWKLVGEDDFSQGPSDPNWDVYGADLNSTNDFSQANVLIRPGMADVSTEGDLSGGMCWCNDAPESLYGRWEIRAEFDPGVDQTPLFLLWPTSNQWPSGGEIDWVQSLSASRSTLLYSLHYGADNSQVHQSASGDFAVWHTYSLEWEPNDITVWVDGVETFNTTNAQEIPDNPMFLAIQTSPINASTAPATTSTIHVAWVKVFAP